MGDSEVLAEAAITFDVPGQTVHSPMVLATINGTETKLILDTGSTAHVLTKGLAEEIGLDLSGTDPGTDHAGAFVPSWAAKHVSINLESFLLSAEEVIVIEGPSAFEEWGIGGFLNPQGLNTTGWTAIDLREDRLFLLSAGVPTRWLSRHSGLNPIEVGRVKGEGIRIPVTLEGYGDLVAMVNTGTPDSEVAKSALHALDSKHVPTRAGLGVSGAVVMGFYLEDQRLLVGDRRFDVDRLSVREFMPPEHPEAQIGMDLLKGTVLAFGPDHRWPLYWMS